MPTTKSRSKKRGPCYVEFEALTYRTAELDMRSRGNALAMGGHPRRWRIEVAVRSWDFDEERGVQVDTMLIIPPDLRYITELAQIVKEAIRSSREQYLSRILSVTVKAHIIHH